MPQIGLRAGGECKGGRKGQNFGMGGEEVWEGDLGLREAHVETVAASHKLGDSSQTGLPSSLCPSLSLPPPSLPPAMA